MFVADLISHPDSCKEGFTICSTRDMSYNAIPGGSKSLTYLNRLQLVSLGGKRHFYFMNSSNNEDC